MRKRIFKSFFLTFVASFAIAFGILYYSLYHVFLNEQRSSLLSEIEVLQFVTDENDLGEYLSSNDNLRYTVIDVNGNVIYDNMASEIQENHLKRAEIKQAKKAGTGSSIRYSDTMEKDYLYVAVYDQDSQRFLRLAQPFESVRQSTSVLIPSFVISGGFAILFVFILSKKLSESIVKPFGEISNTITNTHIGHEPLEFTTNQYPEVQQIEDTLVKMNNRIEQNLKQLESEKVVRQEFFSNASHELKTPLTSIRGYSELLRAHAFTDQEQIDHCLDCILDESDHMTRLIQDIMSISKLEAETVENKKENISIKKILDQVISSFNVQLDSIQLTYVCEDLIVYAEEKHIQMLFYNLISNAIKYNVPHGKIDVRVRHKERDVVIEVEDTGIGISQEDQERIFQRFYRVDKQRTKTIPGTGLGLSIVKHVVMNYGGNIKVESKLNQGTTMIVTLPIYEKSQMSD